MFYTGNTVVFFSDATLTPPTYYSIINPTHKTLVKSSPNNAKEIIIITVSLKNTNRFKHCSYSYYQLKYSLLQDLALPHHFVSVKAGHGLPPRRGCFTISRLRCISPIPQDMLQGLHWDQSDTLQSLGGPEIVFKLVSSAVGVQPEILTVFPGYFSVFFVLFVGLLVFLSHVRVGDTAHDCFLVTTWYYGRKSGWWCHRNVIRMAKTKQEIRIKYKLLFFTDYPLYLFWHFQL